jgi:hypothetical protein
MCDCIECFQNRNEESFRDGIEEPIKMENFWRAENQSIT